MSILLRLSVEVHHILSKYIRLGESGTDDTLGTLVLEKSK